jgi:hypothetical protein
MLPPIRPSPTIPICMVSPPCSAAAWDMVRRGPGAKPRISDREQRGAIDYDPIS